MVFDCKANPILAFQERPPALGSTSSTRTVAALGGRKPSRTSIVVVLLAPFGPSKSYHLSRGDLEADVIDGSETAVALQQILDNDSRHDRNAPLSPPRRSISYLARTHTKAPKRKASAATTYASQTPVTSPTTTRPMPSRPSPTATRFDLSGEFTSTSILTVVTDSLSLALDDMRILRKYATSFSMHRPELACNKARFPSSEKTPHLQLSHDSPMN